VLLTDLANQHEPLLTQRLRRNQQTIRIIPEHLCIRESNTVLVLIGRALLRVELELHGIDYILIQYLSSMVSGISVDTTTSGPDAVGARSPVEQER